MQQQRPRHLRERPVRGRAFAEEATLIRVAPGARDASGRWNAGEETRETITVATAPAMDDAAAVRALLQGMNDGQSIRLIDTRKFWLLDDDLAPIRVGPSARDADRILYQGVSYGIVSVSEWDTVRAAIGVREDPQPT